MINLDALPADQQPNPADLSFVFAEDLGNPNGGIEARFPFTDLPATPADSPYATDIYRVEYSGVADFPNYPSDPFALANAVAGYVYLHPFLLPGWPTISRRQRLPTPCRSRRLRGMPAPPSIS